MVAWMKLSSIWPVSKDALRCCFEVRMDLMFLFLTLLILGETLYEICTAQSQSVWPLRLSRVYFMFYLNVKLRPSALNSIRIMLGMGDIWGLTCISFLAHYFLINFVLYDLMDVGHNDYFDDPRDGVPHRELAF